MKGWLHPDISVLPAKHWALYTANHNFWKVTGKLEKAVHNTLQLGNMAQYIQRLDDTCLDKIDILSFSQVLRSLSIHKRATMVKLIHGWIPTYTFLHKQQQHNTPTCSCCNTSPEPAKHILICTYPKAIHDHTSQYMWKMHLISVGTDPILLLTLIHYIQRTLNLPNQGNPPTGYISKLRGILQEQQLKNLQTPNRICS